MEMIIHGSVGTDCFVTKYVSVNYEAIRNRKEPGTTIEHELIRLVDTNIGGFDRISSVIVAADSKVLTSTINVNGLDVNEMAVVTERLSNAIYKHYGPRDLDQICERVIQAMLHNGYAFNRIVEYVVKRGYHKWFVEMWVDAARIARIDVALPSV